jgi:membrane protein required for colicin V production
MNLFDIISFVIILFFCFWGTKKGFVIEISEIGGLIISFLLAIYFPLELNIGVTKYLVSFLVYFFTIIICFSILSKIIHRTPLAFFDRVLGALIGIVKGGIVVTLLFLLLSFIPLKGQNSNLNDCIFYRFALIVKSPLKDFLQKRFEGLKENKDKTTPPEKPETKEGMPNII